MFGSRIAGLLCRKNVNGFNVTIAARNRKNLEVARDAIASGDLVGDAFPPSTKRRHANPTQLRDVIRDVDPKVDQCWGTFFGSTPRMYPNRKRKMSPRRHLGLRSYANFSKRLDKKYQRQESIVDCSISTLALSTAVVDKYRNSMSHPMKRVEIAMVSLTYLPFPLSQQNNNSVREIDSRVDDDCVGTFTFGTQVSQPCRGGQEMIGWQGLKDALGTRNSSCVISTYPI